MEWATDDVPVFEVKVATAIYELRIHDDANQINEDVNDVVNEGEPLVNRDDDAVALFSAYVSELPPKSLLILGMCANQELTKKEIFGKLGLTSQTNNVRNNLTPLVDRGLVTMIMAKPTSRNQKYTATDAGREFLRYLGNR